MAMQRSGAQGGKAASRGRGPGVRLAGLIVVGCAAGVGLFFAGQVIEARLAAITADTGPLPPARVVAAATTSSAPVAIVPRDRGGGDDKGGGDDGRRVPEATAMPVHSDAAGAARTGLPASGAGATQVRPAPMADQAAGGTGRTIVVPASGAAAGQPSGAVVASVASAGADGKAGVAPVASLPAASAPATGPGMADGDRLGSGAGAPAASAPAFDIVRVAPTGEAVIAGRAAPGADVTIADDGRTIATAHADEQGQFVATPARPLAPGGQALTLAAQAPKGQTAVAGAAPVIVVVPKQTGEAAQGRGQGALAVLAPDGAAPRILQIPTESKGRAHLALDTVDYGDTGKIRFGGSAAPGAPLRLYVDNKPAGDATADHEGHWSMTPADEVAPGRHDLRVDQLASAGSVARRVELPFERATMPAEGLAPGHVVVEPGQNLWRMARQTYGAGIRYLVIYQANAAQIRDPNLIYPGQTFALPTVAGEDGGSMPTSSSRSR